MTKSEHYPRTSVICGAQTKSGDICLALPMENGKCRLHGGCSPKGKQHGRYKHGYRTKGEVAFQNNVRILLKELKGLLKEI